MLEERRQAGLALVAGRCGVLAVRTREERRTLMYAVYLLQDVLGLPLGYRYGWYLRGPYCSEVLHDACALQEGKVKYQDYALSERAEQMIALFHSRILGTRPADVPLDQWLELLTEIHFWAHRDPYCSPNAPSLTMTALLEHKPEWAKLDRTVLTHAWQTLEQAAEAIPLPMAR